jgi:hypothetical protein
MSQTTKKPITCGACGEKGHNKASKKCSKYKAKELTRVIDTSIPHELHAYQLEEIPVIIDIEKFEAILRLQCTSFMKRMHEEYGVNMTYCPIYLEHILRESVKDGLHTGAGSGKMDVLGKNDSKEIVGFDMAQVTFTDKDSQISNEKSFYQGLKKSRELQDRFKSGDHEGAVELYTRELCKKMEATKDPEGNNIGQMNVLVLSVSGMDHYLSCFRIHREHIAKISSAGFTEQKKSVHLKHVIHPENGAAKLYESKARFEVRFHKSILSHPFTKKLSI